MPYLNVGAGLLATILGSVNKNSYCKSISIAVNVDNVSAGFTRRAASEHQLF
ncbi:hypothetical protein ES703_27072 [subsurface metagenome]